MALEDAGELVTIMGHTKKGDGDELKCDEKIVFIMDPIKGGVKKRKISKACSVLLCFGEESVCLSLSLSLLSLSLSLSRPLSRRLATHVSACACLAHVLARPAR